MSLVLGELWVGVVREEGGKGKVRGEAGGMEGMVVCAREDNLA